MSHIRKASCLSTTFLRLISTALILSVVLGGFCVSPVVAPVQAAIEDETSKRDTDSEVAGASKDAKDKLDGFTGGVSGFFDGIKSWFGEHFYTLSQFINETFGAEEDAGMGAFFGTVVWAICIAVLLFIGLFAYNIIKGVFGGGESSVSERYRK